MKTHRVQYIYRPRGRRPGTMKPALRLTGAILSGIGLTIGAAATIRTENGRIIIEATPTPGTK